MLYIPRLSPLMVMRDGRCDLRELLTLTDSQRHYRGPMMGGGYQEFQVYA